MHKDLIMLKNILKTILLLIISLILFSGCGSDSSSDSKNILNGSVIDGAIKDAIVCIDINSNNQCDSNEPSTLTKEDGSFILELDSSFSGEYKVISVGGIDTVTNKEFDGVLQTYLSINSQSISSIITPLTSLASKMYEQKKQLDSKKNRLVR